MKTFVTLIAFGLEVISLYTTSAKPFNQIEAFQGFPLPCSADEVPDSKNGLISEKYRWKNFTVYIDESYSAQERNLINRAIQELSKVLPCVDFKTFPVGTEPTGDYVNVRKGNSCSSVVGKRGGAQGMTLSSPGCMYLGTIMHEMIHSLGLYHEHSRPDRDDFVDILWNNVVPGKEHNFDKKEETLVSHFGVAYNPRSIMHYGSYDFSRNGQPTIQTKEIYVKQNGDGVGSRGKLQPTDILKLQRMYNCTNYVI